MKNTGFTLIELLAVVFVFIAVSTLITSILVGALRGNNKTNTINTVQVNGDYAITQMAKSIRGATSLLSPFPCSTPSNPTTSSSLQLRFPDGNITTYSCLNNGNPVITSNSASLIDTTSVSVSSCQFTCSQDTPTDYPIIGIQFSLQSASSSNFTEQKASSSAIQFQTAVVLRNLIR